jgi:predicted secreted protein
LAVESNLFVVGNKNPGWSNLAELKVEDSRQDAVNKFIPFLVKQLELSNLL